jgi:hypothetical protein
MRVQRIKIVYYCIGEFDLPVSASATKQKKSAQPGNAYHAMPMFC